MTLNGHYCSNVPSAPSLTVKISASVIATCGPCRILAGVVQNVLSNLDLEGSSLTIVAQRAGMTKQAMGRLADELINLKYVKSSRSEDDKRAIKLEFTQAGLKLMNHSFTIMEELENRCTRRLGKKHFKNLLTSLQDIADEFENTPE